MMDTLKKAQEKLKKDGRNARAHVGEAASELYEEGKKRAGELYEEGMNGVHNVEENMKQYSDDVLKKVQKNPLASVLIAAGVGFLLSSILRK